MDGIINVLKPPGMTSFDVIGHLRRVLETKKIGHAGTLDPDAAGVLPVFAGKATKAIEFMMEKEKVYRAEMTLGITTDTGDSSGEIIETRSVNVGEAEIVKAILSFKGKYMQVPPMYSALKVEGQKLYELARKGITIERKPREVTITDIRVINIKTENNLSRVIYQVECSKGTYIRTLCEDIGNKLGCGGHMSFLLRLRAGMFDISRALTLEEIEAYAKSNSLSDKLISAEEVFASYPKVKLDETQLKRFLNGVHIESNLKQAEVTAVYNQKGEFIGLGEVIKSQEGYILKSRKLFL